MAKYNGPVCRFCRREGQKLFLKGERCFTDKCAVDRREGKAPGMHGAKRGKLSEFGQQMREKQKVKRVYGMMETQFRNTFDKAVAERGVTANMFFKRLEMRLDNVVYRMGFARSRKEARQVVRHNHILVNGKRLNIPSAQVAVGDVVSLPTNSQKMPLIGESDTIFQRRPQLGWVEVDRNKFTGKVIAEPTLDDVGLAVKERLIVELYSK